MKLLRICNLAFVFACAVGFAIQSWSVGSEYFSFVTKCNIAPIIPTSHKLPSLSICFSLTSIIGQQGKDERGPQFFDDQSQVDRVLSMTTDQLFAATPNASDLLEMCSYPSHLFDTPSRRLYRGECSQYFDVLKYQMMSYMCYRVGIADAVKSKVRTIDFQRIANSLEESTHKLYSISLHHPLFTGGSKKFLAVAHIFEVPYKSRHFAMQSLSHPTANQSFRISFDLFRITNLPSPYETACNPKRKTVCYLDCLSNKSMPLRLKPKETILTDPSVKLNIATESKPAEFQMVERIKVNCRQLCGILCDEEHTATSLVVFPNSKDKLGFKMVTTANPFIQIIFEPHMLLTEFLTIIGCLLSIWFAASIMQSVNLIFHLLPGTKWTSEHLIKLIELSKGIDFLKKRCDKLKNSLRWQAPNYIRVKESRLKRALNSIAKRERLCTFAFKVLVFALFLYHSITVSQLYFAYGILIKLTRDVGEVDQEVLRLALCFDTTDLVKRPSSKIPNQFNFDRVMKEGDSWTDLTLRQMFQLQFPHAKIVNSCSIRNFRTNRMQFYSSFEECSQHLEVKTFYMRHSMCYRITPRFNSNYDPSRIKSSSSNPFILYSVTSDLSEWRNNHRVLPILYQGDLPDFSRFFASTLYFTKPNRTFVLSYIHYIVHFLPKPYTYCVPNDLFPQYEYRKCISSLAIKTLGRLPYSEMQTEPLDYKFVSYSLLANKTIGQAFGRMEGYCDLVSRNIKCDSTITKTLSSFGYATNTNLTFAAQTPIYTTTFANAIPVVTFAHFLYDTACCFTFWFGLSISFFNPFIRLLRRPQVKLRKLIIKKLNRACLKLRSIVDFSNSTPIFRPFALRAENIFQRTCSILERRKARFVLYINLLLILCCSFHLIYLMEEYFSYHTVLKSYMYIDFSNNVPSSVMCFQIEDIIDDKLDRPVTVSSVFNLTPPADEFLASCGGRGLPSEFRSAHANISNYVLDRMYIEDEKGLQCSKFFEVKKFLMANRICYKMKYKHKMSRINNEFRALSLQATFYDFGFSKNRTFDSYMAIVVKDKPYTSRLFSFKISSSRTHNEWIQLTYIKYSTKCLPFPYDQQNYPDMEFDECISLCVAKATNSTGWVFPLVVNDDPRSDMKILDAKTMFESTMKEFFEQTHDECKSKCKFHRKCDEEFSYYVTIAHVLGTWPGLSFWVRRSDYPVAKIAMFVKMRLCDLILEAGNIVGIWLGLCVLTVNPFKLLKIRTTKLDEDEDEGKIIDKFISVKMEFDETKQLFNQLEKNALVFQRRAIGH